MPKQDELAKSKGKPQSAKVEAKEKQELEKLREQYNEKTIIPTSKPDLIESKEAEKAIKKVDLPAFLQTTEMPELSSRRVTGYVGFAHPMSKKWAQMSAAGLEEGMPYLFHEGRFIPAKTLEFFLCRGESFKTCMNDRGQFIFVTRDLGVTEVNGPIFMLNKQTGQRTIVLPEGGKVVPEPHYIVLLLVNLNGNLIPIKGDFRGTKSGGIETCIRAVESASTPEWGKLSDQHKVSLAFPSPFGRVYHTIRTKPDISKSSGRTFHTTNSVSVPSTIAQMQLLATAFENDDFKHILDEANTNFDKRVEFMEDIAENGPSI